MIKNIILIATGEELLYGTTADTNSSYISSTFFGTNFHIVKHITVGDRTDDIESAIRESLACADIVITTGGLGPTEDDNTLEAVCRIFSVKTAEDPDAKKKMTEFFSSMKMEIREEDFKMISVPEACRVLKNSRGLAPGFMLEKEGRTLISLPGVPAEMKSILNRELLPSLERRYGLTGDQKLLYKISGLRESEINKLVKAFDLPLNIKWGITAKNGLCDLTFVCGDEIFTGKTDIDNMVGSVFSEYLIDKEFSTPQEELSALLKKNGLTAATAESCTGGLIGQQITDIPGASEVYSGTVTAYSNQLKRDILGVSEKTLESFGAVSEQVAAEMAEGICRITGADIGISTTGIAGPGGGSPEKPVGTVCFGFAIKGKTSALTRNISGSRGRVRMFSALFAINYVRKYLKET